MIQLYVTRVTRTILIQVKTFPMSFTKHSGDKLIILPPDVLALGAFSFHEYLKLLRNHTVGAVLPWIQQTRVQTMSPERAFY